MGLPTIPIPAPAGRLELFVSKATEHAIMLVEHGRVLEFKLQEAQSAHLKHLERERVRLDESHNNLREDALATQALSHHEFLERERAAHQEKVDRERRALTESLKGTFLGLIQIFDVILIQSV